MLIVLIKIQRVSKESMGSIKCGWTLIQLPIFTTLPGPQWTADNFFEFGLSRRYVAPLFPNSATKKTRPIIA